MSSVIWPDGNVEAEGGLLTHISLDCVLSADEHDLLPSYSIVLVLSADETR